jgi:lysozyme
MIKRNLVAALSLSASALVALVAHEGYSDKAIIPVKGDKPTLGFGSTVHDNGQPVKLGERTTPPKALATAYAHISQDEAALRRSLPNVELSQAEFDLYVDWTYQYGSGAWQKSAMRHHLLAGEHVQACDALLKYKFVAGYDCSTPGNKRCPGVWSRQLIRHAQCRAAQ